MRYAIGVDLGGTKVEAGLVNGSGKLLKTARLPTGKGHAHVLKQIVKTIDLVWDKRVSGIGVGVPGFTDEKGNVFALTNITSWKRTNLVQVLRKKYRVKAAVSNDADCFALAESRFGKGKGLSPLLGITLGTGVGGGLIIDGKIYRGLGGTEFGHTIVDPSGPKHHSNIPGTMEAWCSGKSIERAFRKMTGRKLSATEICALKSKASKKIVSDASEKLGYALASFVNALSPRCLVIGGGASNISGYVQPALKRMKRLAFPQNVKGMKVYVSKMDSGVVGAAALVL